MQAGINFTDYVRRLDRVHLSRFFVALHEHSTTISPYFYDAVLAGNTTAAASLEEGCQACTEGYYCTDTGNTLATRKICPAGYYCPVGSSSATPCPAGSYNDQTGSWTPDVCARECYVRDEQSQREKTVPTNLVCPHLAFTPLWYRRPTISLKSNSTAWGLICIM